MIPESGDPKYFNLDLQRDIRRAVKETVMSDQKRFIAFGKEKDDKQDHEALIREIFDEWIGEEERIEQKGK